MTEQMRVMVSNGFTRAGLAIVWTFAAGLAAQNPAPTSTLEMRVLARDDYAADGLRFDLAEERRRVLAWLGEADHRTAVVRDPLRIHLFNWRGADNGGPKSAELAWYPHVILPSDRDPNHWHYSFSQNNREAAVGLFSAAEYDAGPTEDRQRLIELLPINLHDRHFTHADLDPARTALGKNPVAGGPCLFFALTADRRAAYEDWSESHTEHAVAIVVDGLVRSAPTFQGRIVGTGVLIGSDEAELRRIVAAVQTEQPPMDAGLLAADAIIAAAPLDRSAALAYAYRLAHAADEKLRLQAAKTLASFGAVPEAVSLLVSAAAGERSVVVLREIVTTLGVAGGSDPAAVQALQRLAQHDDRQVAARAAAALRGPGK